MQQKLDISDAVTEVLWDVFSARVELVYETYKDLPKIQKLTEQLVSLEKEIVKLDKCLYYRIEETRHELRYLYDELIYRQGVMDSEQFYKAFKELGFSPVAENIGGATNC